MPPPTELQNIFVKHYKTVGCGELSESYQSRNANGAVHSSSLLLYLQHPCSRYRTLLHWMGHVGIFKIQHAVQYG